VAGYNSAGCDVQKFHNGNAEECCKGNHYQTSEPQVGGDGNIRFNPASGTLSLIQVAATDLSIAGRQAVTAASEALEPITYTVRSLFDNLTGTALEEGVYYIRCYQGKKYLDISGSCSDENGCKVQLWELGKSSSNNKFEIKRYAGGYTIKGLGRFVEVDANGLLSNNTRVQIWDANIIGGQHAPNQVWLFFKVKDNKYIIRNAGSLKVLDAGDDCTGTNGCRVRQYDAQNSDPTQVWVLEKAN
jgi:hypothetical protein